MTILRDEALLLAWVVSVIVAGLAWEATVAWYRRRRLMRTAFGRIHLAGGVIRRARRFRP